MAVVLFQQAGESHGVRSLKFKHLTSDRMTESKTISMETETPHRVTAVTINLNRAAILVVAHYGMMQVTHVYTNLVLPASIKLELHQRIAISALKGLIVSDRMFSPIIIRR